VQERERKKEEGWVFDLRQPCQGRERRQMQRGERKKGEGGREQPFKKERGGGKGSNASEHSPQGRQVGKKAGKRGNDGEE
jgi:hypothetical protein